MSLRGSVAVTKNHTWSQTSAFRNPSQHTKAYGTSKSSDRADLNAYVKQAAVEYSLGGSGMFYSQDLGDFVQQPVEVEGDEEWEAVSLASSEVSFEMMMDEDEGREKSWRDVAFEGFDEAAAAFKESGRVRSVSVGSSFGSSGGSQGNSWGGRMKKEATDESYDEKYDGSIRVARDRCRKEKVKEAMKKGDSDSKP